MPRPPQAVKKVAVTLQLIPDLAAQLDLELYSEIDGRVPYGAREKVIAPLIQAWIAERQKARERAMAERAHEWRAEQELEARMKQSQENES